MEKKNYEEEIIEEKEEKTETEETEAKETEKEEEADTRTSEEDEEKEDENTLLKEQLLRLQADFENYRNRQEKERQMIVKYANESLILKLLSVVDNFERALEEGPKDDPFCEGVEMIYKELIKVLTDAGLEEIPSDGEEFDPNVHHAVFAEESDDVEADHVIETLQKGYRLNNRVIRPSMVKVSK